MKKLYFTISLLFLGLFISQAQFTVATHHGEAITDGSLFVFSQLGTDADLGFDITNTSGGTIDMRLEYVSMVNGDGTGTWLCVFGNCIAPGGITVGDVFPYAGTNSFTTIAAGVTTDYLDHFYNTYGDGSAFPLDYVFRFFEVDAVGNEIGDSITFTYRYDGTAAVEDENEVSFSLFPTLATDFVNLTVTENVSAQLINTQGQIIKQYKFEAGTNKIDVSMLSKQLYYVLLTNELGHRSLSKIIIK
ncbi:MAG TPA: T9SS type A sorting domain-containing protein [Lutibacter sp.]|nr:T9SS type A sorting domain-containing protein [Lutibacter sp.]